MKRRKLDLQNWSKIFSFTFKHNVKSRGWILTTIIIALVIFLGISAGMMIYEVVHKSREALTETSIKEVYIVDSTEGEADYNYMNMVGDKVYNSIKYIKTGSAAEAAAMLDRDSLILDVSFSADRYNLGIIRNEETDIKKKDAKAYKDFISRWFTYILVQKSGIQITALTELTIPVSSAVLTDGDDADDGLSGVKNAMSVILPYLIILLIYNLILIYGQGVAGSVITEKSSKLMDFFLISVKPSSMILGKMLAIAMTGLIQLLAWVGGIVGGCAFGSFIVRLYSPGSDMPLLKFFAILGEASGMFSAANVILAVFVVVAGFLLYCAIAGIGGALASKAEDLGATNMLFTMLLLVSFFISIYGGGFTGGMVSAEGWLTYVPFTAVLVTPARLIMGDITLLQGLISLALIFILMLLTVIFAGRVYTLTTFWHGNPPKLGTVIKMLKKKKGQA
jgi:ABC-type Na+ efflux pump permease subunit